MGLFVIRGDDMSSHMDNERKKHESKHNIYHDKKDINKKVILLLQLLF